MNTTNGMTFTSKTKTLTTEASTMAANSIYERKATRGVMGNIFIKSHLTGKVLEFTFHKVEYDRDHDIMYWEYFPVDFPAIRKLVIFND